MISEIKNEVKVEVAELLKPVLADQFVLYTKARNYHWNVTGNMFFALHEKFEELYDELANDIDEVAERIRTLGVYSPGSLNEFLKISGKNMNYFTENRLKFKLSQQIHIYQ